MAQQDDTVFDRLLGLLRNSRSRRVSLRTIETMLRQSPGVLTKTNAGATLLHHACCNCETSPEVIRLLIEYGPQAVEMTTTSFISSPRHGETPLHKACTNGISRQALEVLIDAFPEALSMRDSVGFTPLHRACCRRPRSQGPDRSDVILLLLDRFNPVNVGSTTNNVFTPLFLACLYGVHIKGIRRLIRMDPKRVRLRNFLGATPLHAACGCRRTSLKVIKVLVKRFAPACLVEDLHQVRATLSPYQVAVSKRRNAEVTDYLLESTKAVVVALMVCAHSDLVTMPASVRAHVRQATAGDFGSINPMNAHAVAQSIQLNQESLKTLLANDDLQNFLKKEEHHQRLIHGLYLMIQQGQVEGNKLSHVCSLKSKYIDSLFLHLRSNPFLCIRYPANPATHPSATRSEAEGGASQPQPGGEESSQELSSASEASLSGRKRKAQCL
jgi:ankyrin repeat protein